VSRESQEKQHALLTEAWSLLDLKKRSDLCRCCALHHNCERIGGRGSDSPDILFVLSLRDPAAAKGSLLSSASSTFFLTALEEAGIDKTTVRVIPAVLCHPKRQDLKIEAANIGACRARVAREILLTQPLVVVALGTQAIASVFGYTPGGTPSVASEEGQILPALIPGRFWDYAKTNPMAGVEYPVLITESPVLLTRFPDPSPYGNWAFFQQSMSDLAGTVQQFKEIRAAK